jgi:hypothetical protein
MLLTTLHNRRKFHAPTWQNKHVRQHSAAVLDVAVLLGSDVTTPELCRNTVTLAYAAAGT